MLRVMPSTATDPRQLAAELRERINPAYANSIGTESWERKLCAEVIERLMAEARPHDTLHAEIAELRGALYDEKHGITATLRNDQIEAQATRIAELENALEVLRNHVQDDYDRIYISAVLAK